MSVDRMRELNRLYMDDPNWHTVIMLEAQGPPKRIKPLEPCAQAKCPYCGLYGTLGRCNGCGAPNQPVKAVSPQPPRFEQGWR